MKLESIRTTSIRVRMLVKIERSAGSPPGIHILFRRYSARGEGQSLERLVLFHESVNHVANQLELIEQ